jgi:hypothetical protein
VSAVVAGNGGGGGRLAEKHGVSMKPTEETKHFWLMFYAMESFSNVVWACDQLLKTPLDYPSLTHQSLITFILSNYGRPFHRNQGVGRIQASVVPCEYKALHDQLIHERDKIHAHSDAQGAPTRIGNANQVRLLRVSNGFTWTTSTYLPYDENELKQIRNLCKHLIAELDKQTDEYQSQCLPVIKRLAPGEYILNTNPTDSELFTKVESILPPTEGLDITPI